MIFMKKHCFFFLLIVSLLLTGCGSASSTQTAATADPAPQQTKQEPAPEKKEIILATTTSTQDSGLLDVMMPAFEQKSGITVKVVAVGTGQAIKLGEDGNADVLLVHSRKAEDEFVEKGFGVNAYDVMYNQFYIVGPADDPAGIKGTKSAIDAFKKIAEKQATFISRGDDSGTDKKEKSIWKEAGIKPADKWYLSSGQGMGDTLKMADEKSAYTLTDEATFLSHKLGLQVLLQGEKSLLNPYGIMQVKSTSKPELAGELISFFVSPEGQKMIGDFGKEKYGKGLFVPNAKQR